MLWVLRFLSGCSFRSSKRNGSQRASWPTTERSEAHFRWPAHQGNPQGETCRLLSYGHALRLSTYQRRQRQTDTKSKSAGTQANPLWVWTWLQALAAWVQCAWTEASRCAPACRCTTPVSLLSTLLALRRRESHGAEDTVTSKCQRTCEGALICCL